MRRVLQLFLLLPRPLFQLDTWLLDTYVNSNVISSLTPFLTTQSKVAVQLLILPTLLSPQLSSPGEIITTLIYLFVVCFPKQGDRHLFPLVPGPTQ
jgi:hypothetical protein